MLVPRRSSALVLVSAAVAVAPGCFSSSNNGKPSSEIAPDDSGISQEEGGSGSPDAAARDAQQPSDAPSGAPVDAGGADAPADVLAGDSGTGGQVGTSLLGSIYGAASSDGSAMLIVAGGTPNGVWWSHYEPGSGWSAPEVLPATTHTVSSAQVAMDGAGDAFVVWPFNAGEAGVSHYTYGVIRYDHASNTWGQAQYPDTTGKPLWQYPALAVNSGGDALVIDPPDPGYSPGTAPLYAQHYSGGAWAQETVIATADTYEFPYVRLNDSGLAVSVVESGSVGAMSVATRSAAGAWTKATGVVDPIAMGGAAGPSLAINGAGDVLVGWLAGGSSAHPAAYQYDATMQKWTGPTALSTENETAAGACPVGVALTPAGDGVLTRCYYGPSGSSKPALEAYSFAKSSSTWSANPQDATLNGWPLVWSFAFDSTGAGLAALVEGAAGSASGTPIHVVPYSPGSGWGAESATENPDAGSTTSTSVVAFVSPNGANGWVAWSDGSNTFVQKVK